MQLEIKINCPDPDIDLHIPYVTWSPAICHIRAPGNSGDTELFLRPKNLGRGRIVFTDAKRETVSPTTSVVCVDDEWTTFYIAGDFGYASTRDKDIVLNIYEDDPKDVPLAEPVETKKLMVRVRKDAETLTPDERKRFVRAFALLNKKDGYAFYRHFTQMHIANTDDEIHKYENFLSWHRLYLLNLERDLQKIDSSVSLHYWRWDFPAPNLFSEDFAGKMDIVEPDDANGSGPGSKPIFSDDNLWRNWRPPGSPALLRSAWRWDVAENGGFVVLVERAPASEAYAIALGGGKFENLFWGPNRKRGESTGFVFSKPHGAGHMSFRGQISAIDAAPQDPVFFMLHCNVDRQWAAWQNYWDRFGPTDEESYSPQGKSPNRTEGFGAYSEETQWPWNGDNQHPRPPQTPYGKYPTPLTGYDVLPKPSATPTNEEVIDYKGRLAPENCIGFDYDNIPFHFSRSEHSSDPTSMMMAGKEIFQQILDKELGTTARLSALASAELIDDSDDYEALVGIAFDQEEPAEIRIKAMNLLALHSESSEAFIGKLLGVLNDVDEPAEVRRGAMSQIRLFSLGGPAFREFRPTVTVSLRGLIRDEDQNIAKEAIDLLAYQHDEFIQRVLREGLENPDDAVATPFSAVHYLSLDPHDHIDVFRTIAEEPGEEDVRTLAIQALASDTNSRDFLVALFRDKEASSEIREACAHALDAQDPDEFQEKSVEVLKDEEETDHRLATLLLSKLTLSENLGKIGNDADLLNKLQVRADRGGAPETIALAERSDEAKQNDSFSSLLKELTSLIDILEQ